MSGTGRDGSKSLFTETLHIPAGVTIIVAPIAGQLGFILERVSGGSLGILNNPLASDIYNGSTTVGSSFTVANIYTLGTGEILNVSHETALYLYATGATCVAQLLRMRSLQSAT